MQALELVVVGGGKMGTALARGLLDSGVTRPEATGVVEVAPGRRAALEHELPGVVVTEAVPPCAAAVIAVKPADVTVAIRAAVEAGARRVISVAAGIMLDVLEAAAGDGVAVVRAMPNTPALVRQGMTAIAAGVSATEDDLVWAEAVLGAVGHVVRVPESAMDAVTALSGSGPAYLFLIAEALIDAGVLVGLPRPVADTLVRQLFVGSAALLAGSPESPAALRADVTSPGGTTAAALRVLEQRAVRGAVIDAAVACAERSRTLGGRPASG
jgi:pyrroline-5-carboxylate reductase